MKLNSREVVNAVQKKQNNVQSGRPVPLLYKTLIYVILISFGVVFLYPLFWMLAASLRSLQEIAISGMNLWPQSWRWDNYEKALSAFPFWRALYNSLLTTFLPILGTVFSCSLVAFAFARLKVRGNNALFIIVLSTMLLPGEVTMIPQFILIKKLGMIDTLYPLMG
jgi:multiple sugar transport system permease protein